VTRGRALIRLLLSAAHAHGGGGTGDDGAKADGSEPDREQLPPLSTEYQTRSYALLDFSSEEWTSPRKTERLRELELLAQGDTTTTEVP
jgi:hypothetical protein